MGDFSFSQYTRLDGLENLKLLMWYIYIMEYYSAIKRNKIGSFVEMWMDLEIVIQSEVSQKKKNRTTI